MMGDLKSFEMQPLSNGMIFGRYDGDIVHIPLIEYNRLVSASKKAQEVENPISRFKGHRGDKSGCGRLADAMMLADAVNGLSNAEIQKRRYPYDASGHKKIYGSTKVKSALSVNKPGDLERISGLINDYPNVLGGIREEVFDWMQKRQRRGKK